MNLFWDNVTLEQAFKILEPRSSQNHRISQRVKVERSVTE